MGVAEFLQFAAQRQAQNEANARSRTFNIGKLLPALVAAPFTGGTSLISMGLPAALGEGVRAATGSSEDLAGLATDTVTKFAPKKPLNATDMTTSTNAGRVANVGNTLGNFGKFLQDSMYAPESTEQFDLRKRIAENPGMFKEEIKQSPTGDITRGYTSIADDVAKLKRQQENDTFERNLKSEELALKKREQARKEKEGGGGKTTKTPTQLVNDYLLNAPGKIQQEIRKLREGVEKDGKTYRYTDKEIAEHYSLGK